MTKDQLSQALQIAKSDKDLHLASIDIFFGFGLEDFEPVYCTIDQVAALIRWQAVQFNGGIDSDALQEVCNVGRKKFLVLN